MKWVRAWSNPSMQCNNILLQGTATIRADVVLDRGLQSVDPPQSCDVPLSLCSCPRYSTGSDRADEANAERTTIQWPTRAARRATLWQSAQPWIVEKQKNAKGKQALSFSRWETYPPKTYRNFIGTVVYRH